MSKTSSFGTSSREGHDASKFYSRKLYEDIKGEMKGEVKAIDRGKSEECSNGEVLLGELDVIHHGDSRDMVELGSSSVHLMVTSPPYNVGKEYDKDLTLKEYRELLSDVLEEVYRVLVEGGRACINIANIGRSPYIPLHSYVVEIAERIGFLMRGEVIWDKGASAGSSCAWGSWRSASNPVLRDVHEYILIFSKGGFKRHSSKESTISRDNFLESTKSIWRFASESARRVGHPAPFPLELPLRLIHLYSYEGDIVLDPFMGSGTTAQAAQQTRRKYIGYEIEKEYIKVAERRLACSSLDIEK